MKKMLTTVIARLSLALVFAILVISLKWEYIQWGVARVRVMHTIFYPSMIVFIAVLILSALVHPVRELYRNRQLPFQGPTENALSILKSSFSKLSVQFAFWGLFSATLIGLTWETGLLQDEEFRFNQVAIPWKGVENSENSRVGVFSYTSVDNNTMDYFKNCAKIVRDMKAVGVKVVIIPLPFLISEEMMKYVKEMNETGIAVFAVRNATDHFISVARKDWSVKTGHMTLDIYNRNPWKINFVGRVQAFPQEKYPLWRDLYDVSLVALRVYYGIPNAEIRREKSSIVIDNIRFPIADDGKIYAGRLAKRDYYLVQPSGIFGLDTRGFPVISGTPRREQKFEYWQPKQLGRVEIHSNLEGYRDSFEGKIMIIQWGNIGGSGLDISFWESSKYAYMLDHMIRGETLVRSGIGSLLIALMSILGCGLILYRSQLVSSAAVLMLFCGATLYGSAWLFQEKGILVDMPAIMAAMIVAISVFTVLRLGHEWRLGSQPGLPRGGKISSGTPPKPALAFFRKKLSISPALATGLTVLIVILTALISGGVNDKDTRTPEREVVYVTSLPTVEVQGMYVPDKQAKQ